MPHTSKNLRDNSRLASVISPLASTSPPSKYRPRSVTRSSRNLLLSVLESTNLPRAKVCPARLMMAHCIRFFLLRVAQNLVEYTPQLRMIRVNLIGDRHRLIGCRCTQRGCINRPSARCRFKNNLATMNTPFTFILITPL